MKSELKNDIVPCIADVVQWLERGTFTPTPINAGVAQWLERAFHKRQVGSSNLPSGTRAQIGVGASKP